MLFVYVKTKRWRKQFTGLFFCNFILHDGEMKNTTGPGVRTVYNQENQENWKNRENKKNQEYKKSGENRENHENKDHEEQRG